MRGDAADARARKDFERECTVSAQSALRSIENHVAEREARRIVIAVDHQMRELRGRRAAFEQSLKLIPSGVMPAVVFEIRDADGEGIGVGEPPLFHHFKAAEAARLQLAYFALHDAASTAQ